MTARAAVRQSDLARVIRAARAVDPGAVVEVTRDGTMRIIPQTAAPKAPDDPFDLIDMRRE